MKYEIKKKKISAAQKWILDKQFCAIFVKVFRGFVTRRFINALLLVFFIEFGRIGVIFTIWNQQRKKKKKRNRPSGFFFAFRFVRSIRFHGYIVAQHQIAEILSFDWKEKHKFFFCCWNFWLKGLFSHLFSACNAQQLYDDRYHVNKFSLEAIIFVQFTLPFLQFYSAQNTSKPIFILRHNEHMRTSVHNFAVISFALTSFLLDIESTKDTTTK